MLYLIMLYGYTLLSNPRTVNRKKQIKTLNLLQVCLILFKMKTSDKKHLVILVDAIFRVSDHPEVVKIFTHYRHD